MHQALAAFAFLLLAPLTLALAEDAGSIDSMARSTLATGKAPGFSLAVQKDGKPLFVQGHGLADADSRKPVTPATRFAIGPISKQFTAVAILQLAERGKLTLDDPIGRYLPNLPNANAITIRMLLHQIGGLHNYPSAREHAWPCQGTIPPARILAILAKDKADFAPDARFAYSNTNYFALAAIVEKVSGLSYGDYFTQHIFAPLGMSSSGNGFAAQHNVALPQGGQGDPRLSLDLFLGAGSVVSTAPDLALWNQALLDGKLLKPTSMKLLFAPGKPTQGDEHLAIVVLSNGPDFAPEPENLVRAIAEKLLPVTPVQQTATPPATATPAAPTPPVEDPAVTAMALKIYAQMRAGKVDPALLTPEMAAAATPEIIAQMKPMFDTLGDPKQLKLESVEKLAKLPKGTSYLYLAIFPTAQFHISLFITPDGRVGGYKLHP